ncbi:MAG: Gfo/Idh/MocA family oxidoreductase [Akkermansiaceae bacterium]|nr:Gfo/Idh/MocA family oxidoreductase [Akkermansiaceae bacterium]MCF7733773.1 Gfo/Idh/MocA family oxidoreductase [Akkermansiaceae bacterium]
METIQSNIPRRDFLQRTAAGVGAGLVLGAPGILRAAQGDRGGRINVALLGHGKQGQVLFESMKNIPGLNFQAVCDIWKYNRGAAVGHVYALQKQRPNAYEDVEEMLATEKGLDAVVIATPDFWHSPHTVKCLEAGLNVYCEKMMANTIDGARAMVHAAEKSGKLCQIGHQRRSNPRYRFTLEQLINGNKICGQIVNVNGQWNRSLSGSQDIAVNPKIAMQADILNKYGFKDMHQFMNWRFYRDLSGGAISDLGAHQIDIFNWFLGAVPTSVFATGGNSYFKEREHFDNVMALFDYDTPQGQVRAFYQVLTTTSAGGGYYESFMGTQGTIDISEIPTSSNIFRETGDQVPSWNYLLERGLLKPKPAAPKPKTAGVIDSRASPPPEGFMLPGEMNKPAHQPHLENFFAAVRGEAKLNCDARHAFLSEAPIYYVNPSALSKQPIVFTPEQLSV